MTMKFRVDQPLGESAPSVTSLKSLQRSRRRAIALLQRAVVAAEPLESRTLFASTLTPTADADVEMQTADANYANANFGADTQLRVSGDANDTIESLLTFDISGVTSVGSATVDFIGGADPDGPIVTNSVSI